MLQEDEGWGPLEKVRSNGGRQMAQSEGMEENHHCARQAFQGKELSRCPGKEGGNELGNLKETATATYSVFEGWLS